MAICRRIVLDTNCFRGLKAKELLALRNDGFKISVGQSALYEAWAAAAREARPGIVLGPARELSEVIDPDYPIAPTRGDLLWRFSATRRRHDQDRTTPRYRAWATLNWRLAATGNVEEGELQRLGLEANDYLAGAGSSWKRFAAKWAQHDQVEAFRALPDRRRRSLFVNHITSDLWSRGFRAGLVRSRLHAFFHAIAWHMWSTATGATTATDNDSEDLAGLMHLAESAFVLTHDEKLIRAVDLSKTYQAPWVRTLAEMHATNLPTGRPWGVGARRTAGEFIRSKT
jgi:hypothetical protein